MRVKELEDERGRLTRTNAAQTQQIDKFKKIAEDSKTKTDGLETQLTSTRKVTAPYSSSNKYDFNYLLLNTCTSLEAFCLYTYIFCPVKVIVSSVPKITEVKADTKYTT